jgi:hypothetical protein
MRLTSPKKRESNFLRNHTTIIDIMQDKDLAKLGDAYINFTYSLAESYRRKRGSNIRVPTKTLSESLKNARLRILMPKRTPSHDQADAVEALAVYSWLTDTLSFEECVSILSEEGKEDTELFTKLIEEIIRRLEPSIGKTNTVQGN